MMNKPKKPMMKKPMMKKPMAKKPMPAVPRGGMNKGFKPCATCPNPAKCKAMGKCMKKTARR